MPFPARHLRRGGPRRNPCAETGAARWNRDDGDGTVSRRSEGIFVDCFESVPHLDPGWLSPVHRDQERGRIQPVTGVYVGSVAEIQGTHRRGATLDERSASLKEAIAMILENGAPMMSD